MKFVFFLLNLLIVSELSAQEVLEGAEAVPEPSMGGLAAVCGLFFLLWRRK